MSQPRSARTISNSDSVRFATFNASLNRGMPGQILTDLGSPGHPQAAAVAEIIQRVRPDVLVINELDYLDGPREGNVVTDAFRDNYLSRGQDSAAGIDYPFVFVAPSNTGVPSGRDLDKDGHVDGPGDAFGWGRFPGQFAMAVLSRYPIHLEKARTFRHFLWKDMPGANLPSWPDHPAAGALAGKPFYDAGDLEILRLSSKSHWDLPIAVAGRAIHLLASHPTPPIVDGPDRRRLGRNSDEIRFWADYVTPGAVSAYIYDDESRYGGLAAGSTFVIAGDMNADPNDGASAPGAIGQLLEHPLVNTSVTPASEGGAWAAASQGGVNLTHIGDPRHDTADFRDTGPRAPGNLRVDYVLPSRELDILEAGIFWPTPSDPLFRLTGSGSPVISSDHRLVWIDLDLQAAPSQSRHDERVAEDR